MTDIWELHSRGYWAVIPTNLQIKVDTSAIMGAGLAKQCVERFPQMPYKLGQHLYFLDDYAIDVPYMDLTTNIICCATKHHWKDKSDLNLIAGQLSHINTIFRQRQYDTLAIPRLGCGLGGLNWEAVVKPLIVKMLPDCKYVFCEE